MDLSKIFKKAAAAARDNAPAILTAVGVTGVVTTAVLTAKATFKAADKIRDEQERLDKEEQSHPLTTQEKVKLVWPEYIPAAGVGLMAVTAVLAANHVSSDRAAAMASAYTIAQKGLTDYRDKVVEMIGDKKEEEVREEVAKDRIKAANFENVVLTPRGDALFLDTHSGRVFRSDMESVRAAVNDINAELLANDYASLSEFYDHLGIPRTAESDEIGWNVDARLKVKYTTDFTPDGKQACVAITFDTIPVRGYFVTH